MSLVGGLRLSRGAWYMDVGIPIAAEYKNTSYDVLGPTSLITGSTHRSNVIEHREPIYDCID